MKTSSPDDLVCENCGNEDQEEFYPTIEREKGDHEMTCARCDWADSVTTRRERDELTAKVEADERRRIEERERLRTALSSMNLDDL